MLLYIFPVTWTGDYGKPKRDRNLIFGIYTNELKLESSLDSEALFFEIILIMSSFYKMYV